MCTHMYRCYLMRTMNPWGRYWWWWDNDNGGWDHSGYAGPSTSMYSVRLWSALNRPHQFYTGDRVYGKHYVYWSHIVARVDDDVNSLTSSQEKPSTSVKPCTLCVIVELISLWCILVTDCNTWYWMWYVLSYVFIHSHYNFDTWDWSTTLLCSAYCVSILQYCMSSRSVLCIVFPFLFVQMYWMRNSFNNS